MSIRITLLCLPASPALRRGCFPADEALDQPPGAGLTALEQRLDVPNRILCSPAAAARQFAEALAWPAQVEQALAEVDYGCWAGLSLKEVEAGAPDSLAGWLADPAAAPHGGESQLDLLGRIGSWLQAAAQWEGNTLALTHASVIRAAVIHALQAPPSAVQCLDIAPLTATRFTVYGGRLRLAGAGLTYFN